MRSLLALTLLFAPFPLSGAAPVPALYAVLPGTSRLKYTIKHELHEVTAEARTVEGKLSLREDGNAQVMVRAKIADFRSGDSNRDEHMLETMQAAHFPFVVFKGVVKIASPATYPATLGASLEGELDFHGRKRRETFPITVEPKSPTELRASGTLRVSLEAYAVERPSLLLLPIEDTCTVDLDLSLQEEK